MARVAFRPGRSRQRRKQSARPGALHEFAVETQYLRAREWVKQHPGDHRADRVADGDGVTTPSCRLPPFSAQNKSVRVGARRDQLTVCGDDVV